MSETYDAVRVFTGSNVGQAYFIKGILDNEGIASEIRNEFVYDIRGGVQLTPDTLPQVWVDKKDEAHAKDLIKTADPVTADPWVCPNCKQALEGQFTSCWSCGTDRPS